MLFLLQKGENMNTKLYNIMQQNGDTMQELANYLGLSSYVSIHRKLYGQTSWKKNQIKMLCKKYKKTQEELGL